MASGFSSALKLADLDDFITPSQECIKPVDVQPGNPRKMRGSIKMETSQDEDIMEPVIYEKAKITLNDCLACSGCITTAESVLVNQQSFTQLMKVVEDNKTSSKEDKRIIVLSLSPQSISSLSAKYSIDVRKCTRKIAGYFKTIGVDYVFDTNLARCFSLHEARNEFIHRYKTGDERSLPMLASACPGWVCYAEKAHGSYILPYISTTRSPQQIMGSLVKNYWATKENIPPSKIFHATLMPCFDKKLEASRNEFFLEQQDTREVDLVLTTIEVEEFLDEAGINMETLCEGDLNPDLSLCGTITSHGASSSGGYAHHVFIHAAEKLFDVSMEEIGWKTLRNNDFQETTLEVHGRVVLRFALAYGFRNIQNLIQKIKRNKCNYDYVEIMACPSGCLNGGAQLRPRDGKNVKEMLLEVEKCYKSIHQVELDDHCFMDLYSEWLGDAASTAANLHTSYKEVQKTINPLTIKW